MLPDESKWQSQGKYGVAKVKAGVELPVSGSAYAKIRPVQTGKPVQSGTKMWPAPSKQGLSGLFPGVCKFSTGVLLLASGRA
jgi:hypothetical protein